MSVVENKCTFEDLFFQPTDPQPSKELKYKIKSLVTYDGKIHLKKLILIISEDTYILIYIEYLTFFSCPDKSRFL